MTPRYYSITAYGAPGQTFPKFNDSYLTLLQARPTVYQWRKGHALSVTLN